VIGVCLSFCKFTMFTCCSFLTRFPPTALKMSFQFPLYVACVVDTIVASAGVRVPAYRVCWFGNPLKLKLKTSSRGHFTLFFLTLVLIDRVPRNV
jgi:hypothetical protein